jgi:hypothetical protein
MKKERKTLEKKRRGDRAKSRTQNAGTIELNLAVTLQR